MQEEGCKSNARRSGRRKSGPKALRQVGWQVGLGRQELQGEETNREEVGKRDEQEEVEDKAGRRRGAGKKSSR